jgi:hypothetical protein
VPFACTDPGWLVESVEVGQRLRALGPGASLRVYAAPKALEPLIALALIEAGVIGRNVGPVDDLGW